MHSLLDIQPESVLTERTFLAESNSDKFSNTKWIFTESIIWTTIIDLICNIGITNILNVAEIKSPKFANNENLYSQYMNCIIQMFQNIRKLIWIELSSPDLQTSNRKDSPDSNIQNIWTAKIWKPHILSLDKFTQCFVVLWG